MLRQRFVLDTTALTDSFAWESEGASSIRHKMLLSEMERDSPGTKLQFYLGFLRARQAGAFTAIPDSRPEMNPCRTCGQPTTAGDLCAFCRLWEKVEARKSNDRFNCDVVPVGNSL